MSSSCSSPNSVALVQHWVSKAYPAPSIQLQKTTRETLRCRNRRPMRRNSCACHFVKAAPAADLRRRACDSKVCQKTRIRSSRVVQSRGSKRRARRVRESRVVVLKRYAPSSVGVRAVACPICNVVRYDRRMLLSDAAIASASYYQESVHGLYWKHLYMD